MSDMTETAGRRSYDHVDPIERLAALETDMKNVREDVRDMRSEVGEMRSDFKRFIESSDRRYAAKWTERALFTTGGAIMLSVIYYVLAHVGISS